MSASNLARDFISKRVAARNQFYQRLVRAVLSFMPTKPILEGAPGTKTSALFRLIEIVFRLVEGGNFSIGTVFMLVRRERI